MFELQTLIDVQVLAFGSVGLFVALKCIDVLIGIFLRISKKREEKTIFNKVMQAIDKTEGVEVVAIKKGDAPKKSKGSKAVR